MDLNAITAGLIEDGVDSFAQSFVALLAGLDAMRAQYPTELPRAALDRLSHSQSSAARC